MVKETRLNVIFIGILCVLFVSKEKLKLKHMKCEVHYIVERDISV
jgi:hypothetical protein